MTGGWPTRKFSEIADRAAESVAPIPSDSEHYVGLEHLDSECVRVTRWGSEVELKGNKLHMREGDVLFARRNAYLRRVAVAPFDGLFSAHGLVLRARPNVMRPDLLPFFMLSGPFYERSVAISVGSLSPTINWSALARQQFAVPPRDEQDRIAGLLWEAEAAVAAHEQVVEAARSALVSLGRDVFGRQSRHVPCAGLCSRITVGIVVKPAQWYAETGVLALRSLNVFPNCFVLDDVKYISAEGHEAHRKSAIDEGDVLVVRTGRPGDTAVAGPELAGSNCIDLILARPGAKLDARYLSRYLNSPVARGLMARQTVGSAQQHFNVGSLKTLPVPVASLEEQRRVAELFEAAERVETEARAHIERLRDVQRRLVDELLAPRDMVDDVH